MRIEIRRNKSLNPFNRYYYVIVAANEEDLSVSEPYFSKSNAMRAARKVGSELGMQVKDTTVKGYNKHGGFK